MKVVDPQITISNEGSTLFPFTDFYNSNQTMTRAYMERLGALMLSDLQADFEEGHQSNNPLTQRNVTKQRRTGGYFSVQTYLSHEQYKKLPVFFITSTAVNSLAYEASHGNMQRLLATYASKV